MPLPSTRRALRTQRCCSLRPSALPNRLALGSCNTSNVDCFLCACQSGMLRTPALQNPTFWPKSQDEPLAPHAHYCTLTSCSGPAIAVSSAIFRISCVIRIEQNFGPHIEQNLADLKT